MSRVQALQLFRQCSSSFASRQLARSSANAAGRRLAGARLYSAQASEEGSKQKEQEREDAPRVEETEKDEVEVTPEHEVVAKLKKKEAEVSDLMVSRSHDSPMLPESQCCVCHCQIGPATISSSRLP